MNPSRTAPPSALTVAAWMCGVSGVLAMLTSPGSGFLELIGRILFVTGIILWILKAARKGLNKTG